MGDPRADLAGGRLARSGRIDEQDGGGAGGTESWRRMRSRTGAATPAY